MSELIWDGEILSPEARYIAAIADWKSRQEVVQILEAIGAEQKIRRWKFSAQFLLADSWVQSKMRSNFSRLQLRHSESLKNDDDRLTATLGIYLLGTSEDFFNACTSGDSFLQIMIDHKWIHELLEIAPEIRIFMVNKLAECECEFSLEKLLAMQHQWLWRVPGKPDETAKKIYERVLFFAMRKFLMEW